MAILKINDSTSPISLKEMSSAEYDYIVDLILSDFISSSNSTGTILVNPANTSGLTLIGSFVDTYRPYAPGTSPAGSELVTVTYEFYQNLQTVTEGEIVRPVELTDNIEEQDDLDINLDVANITIANLVSNGVGGYVLSTAAPTSGGTWTIQSSVSNQVNPSTSEVTYLWRKTATATAPAEQTRPLKINTDTTPVSLKQMSDVEIKTLTSRIRNQIVSTGRGTYKLQATAPTGGTWITQGSAFADTRNTIDAVAYTGYYSGTYAGTYLGTAYTGTYATNFIGNYSRAFTGTYTGTYASFYTGTYTGSYANFFSGNYVSSFAGSYTGTYSRNFSGSYSGTYFGSYLGVYQGTYFNSFYGTYLGLYLGIYWSGSQYYSAYYSAYYGGSYLGTFVGYYSAYYSGSRVKSFTGNYTGNFTGFYTGFYSRNFTGSYTNFFTGNYSGSYVAFFSGNYSGNYIGTFTGSYASNFTGNYSANYTGNYTGAYTGYYLGGTITSNLENVSGVALWLRVA